MTDRINIHQANEHEYQVNNLPRNEAIWLQVENFDLYIKRTDGGIEVEIHDTDSKKRKESIDNAFAFDSDTTSYQEED